MWAGIMFFVLLSFAMKTLSLYIPFGFHFVSYFLTETKFMQYILNQSEAET